MTHRRRSRSIVLILLPLFVLALVPVSLLAASGPAKAEVKAERALDMDYGPFLSTSVVRKAAKSAPSEPVAGTPAHKPAEAPPDVIALKGIAIRLGGVSGPPRAAVCFDTDRLTVAAGWTGGFIDTSNTMLTNHKGTGYTTLEGSEWFHCNGLGWSGGGKTGGGDFTDPRPGALGPLPRDRGHYKGLYLNGDRVILSYQVAGNDVLELPAFESAPGAAESTGVFTRTLRIERSDGPLSLAICEVEGAEGSVTPATGTAVLRSHGEVTAAGVVAAPNGAALHADAGHIRLSLPPLSVPAVFKIVVWKGSEAGLAHFAEGLKSSAAPVDPKPLCAGGAPRWKESLAVAGQLGDAAAKDKFPYVVDTIGLPDANPWRSWMRLTGLDFFSDGRAAVCTLNGDVWIVSGIDEKLQKQTWRRFATGLYQPLGLKVVKDQVYVLGRDQITRLHDLNNDGEADFYENFNSDGIVHPLYNAFACDLQTDTQGNFYYSRNGHALPAGYPGHGYVFEVSPDGTTSHPVASGVRAANGLGEGPDGLMLVSDNEGEWTPASRINLLRPGRAGERPEFFGFVPQSHRDAAPMDYGVALCWIPHKIDTSSGGAAYITDDRWGPYKGQWVHTSYGTSALFLLLVDESEGRYQGATMRLPLNFATGIMRPRFNPVDGQLYVCGVGGGWQTSGTRDGALYRVRYTQKPAYFPSRFHVVAGGVRLTFPSPLNLDSAADEQDWGVEQWTYKWAAAYGSPDQSVKTPGKPGHDSLDVKAAKVSDDGLTVMLQIPGLAPVMQMLIQCNVKGADGTPVSQEIYATINHVPVKGE